MDRIVVSGEQEIRIKGRLRNSYQAKENNTASTQPTMVQITEYNTRNKQKKDTITRNKTEILNGVQEHQRNNKTLDPITHPKLQQERMNTDV